MKFHKIFKVTGQSWYFDSMQEQTPFPVFVSPGTEEKKKKKRHLFLQATILGLHSCHVFLKALKELSSLKSNFPLSFLQIARWFSYKLTQCVS